jgi:predicted DNA-binding ArsR family transcriptional regulator
MTPKEKAKDLVLKFKELPQEGTLMYYVAFEISKQCALIAVDEVLKCAFYATDEIYDYYHEVKLEIEKL